MILVYGCSTVSQPASSAGTQDVVWLTSWERWMIGTDGERESRESMPQGDLMRMMMLNSLLIHKPSLKNNVDTI